MLEIIVVIGTHLVQSVTLNERCVNFSVLGEKNISLALHFLHKLEKELIHKFNVSKNNPLLCSPINHNQTHNIYVSVGVGDWSMYVYDTSDEKKKRQPAVELHNIDVTVRNISSPPEVSPPEQTASEQTVSSSFTSKHSY